ncbi:sugar ABC transporter permease [Agrobacterium vitis]|uniref:ABC transporter permease subunit n=1 Tax=Agrobacterium vitis TaxID=373 RepID=A0AAE4WKN8_AGRVI|nr:sugar ABC transporter permease [Agrobacterium vitis]MCF1501804.1 sugar ABC transporter permease [Allorhizobium sp. Av2]MCM2443306.1 sugar ABC transporter permease [Agrobacterium vitis]MUZ60932.1 ABC transporter permease subunit [Agrobacterium vitis]MVA69210.1 ABC transporter permease subunit [Agrobacterium vitis]MVA90223.1 ABC transporter permease subunit [Agrobacterium vitis]
MSSTDRSIRRVARPWRISAHSRANAFPYMLVAPVVLLIVGLVAYPFLYAIYVAFTNRMVGNDGEWVGLANFRHLAQTATFLSAARNTIVIVLVSDVVKLALGLGLALLVNRNIPGRGFFRAFLMLPWAMPAFVAFLTWRVLYQPIGGGINLILTETGIYPHIVDWLGQTPTALPAVIMASVWRGFPFWFVSILAALQSIPKELYEAARVDGANAWQRFRDVTLPGIRQVLVITTLLSSIWTANGFEHVWLLTQGGPSDGTMVFPVLAYFGMQTQRIGEAAAVSVAMLPAMIVLVLMATFLMQKDDD